MGSMFNGPQAQAALGSSSIEGISMILPDGIEIEKVPRSVAKSDLGHGEGVTANSRSDRSSGPRKKVPHVRWVFWGSVADILRFFAVRTSIVKPSLHLSSGFFPQC